MVKLEDPNIYLTGEFAEKNNVSEVIPLEEGAYVEREFEDKTTHKSEKKRLFDIKVQCNDTEQSIKTWSPNNTSIKTLIELGDGDTKNLIGKRIPIIRSYNQSKWIVYVKPDMTKEKLAELNKAPAS